MRRNFLFLITLFMFFLPNQSSFSQIVYSNNSVEVTNLTDNIYLLKEKIYFIANILACTGPDGVVLCDSGFREAADDLVKAVEHLKSGNVKYIINSHAHGDHVGANSSFGRKVIIIGHNNCEDSFTQKGLESITFEEEYSFTFNEKEITCFARPGGHSPCDIVIYIPAVKIAYLGDMYLSESFPLISIRYGARAQKLVDNLKEVCSLLPEDTRIIPGHGRLASMEDLKSYIDMVERTIRIVRTEMEAGKGLKEIQDRDVLKDWGEWGTFFEFITKESWIEDIFYSYSASIRRQ